MENDNLIWLLLGSLISSDTNIDLESSQKSLERLEKIKDYAEKGIEIVKRDIESFKLLN